MPELYDTIYLYGFLTRSQLDKESFQIIILHLKDLIDDKKGNVYHNDRYDETF